MKKVFISQPMNGKSEEAILNKRNKAIKEVREFFNDDVTIIDSFLKDEYKEELSTPCSMLGKAIQLLGTADVAYFVDGWNAYRGCRFEYEIAKAYGIPVMEE